MISGNKTFVSFLTGTLIIRAVIHKQQCERAQETGRRVIPKKLSIHKIFEMHTNFPTHTMKDTCLSFLVGKVISLHLKTYKNSIINQAY